MAQSVVEQNIVKPAAFLCEKVNKPAVLISHPTGNQNVRNAIRSLAECGMLAEFWTTIVWDENSRWNQLLPNKLRAILVKRAFAEIPKKQVHRVPWREIVRLGAGRNFLKNLLCTGEKAFSIIGVYRHFDSKVACQLRTISPSAVYAYEGGARQTFREAKRMGLTTLYELPSSYWYWEYRFLAMEAERKPEFAGLLPKLKDSPDHMRWKDEELDLADYVIVPSQHVCQTLSGIIPNDKIRIINYGAPPVRPSKLNQFTPTRPLKVIFVGALTQRKGISYLLDAVDMLGPSVSLTMVGRRFCANERVDDYCRRSRWFESLSYNRVLDVMSESDVLVLPSLCEAFGLVVTEALACGLPVIVTPNVGAVDLLVDGREGFIVPLCSAEAIACRLNVLSRDRELLAIMSSRARITAAKRSWKNYRASFAEMIESTI